MTNNGRLIEHDELAEDVYFEDGEKNNPKVAVDDWIKEIGGKEGTEVRVYRDASEETRGKQPFIFSFSPEDYSLGALLVELRDGYGSGSYWVKAYSGGRLLFNKRVAVESKNDKKPEIKEAIQTQTSPFGNDGLAKLLTDMQAKTDDKFMMLINFMGQQKPAEPATPPLTMTDMMDFAIKMKSLGGNENQFNPMDILTKGMDLANSMNKGSGDKETNLNDLMMELVSTFGKPMGEMVKQMGQNKETPVALPQPGQTIVKTLPVAAQTVGVKPEPNPLGQITALLLNRAKAGGDPILCADLVLETIPNVTDMLQGKSIGEFLIAINPAVGQYGPWFDQLNVAVYNPYDEDDENVEKVAEKVTDVEENSIESIEAEFTPNSKKVNFETELDADAANEYISSEDDTTEGDAIE